MGAIRADGLSANLAKTSSSKKAKEWWVLSDVEREHLERPEIRRLIKQRFYQWVLDQADSATRLNWPRVAEKVALFTGVSIPKESLRQNFMPTSKQGNKKRREFRDLESWAAIYRFISSDQVGYLLPEELEQVNTPMAGFIALNAFLSPNEEATFPKGLVGRYTNERNVTDSDQAELSLTIGDERTSGLASVYLLEEATIVVDHRHLTYTIAYQGAALSASGFVVLIIKSVLAAKPRIYALAQTEPPLSTGQRIEGLALWPYRGLASEALLAHKIYHDDDEREGDLTGIRYQFEGGVRTEFLTRC